MSEQIRITDLPDASPSDPLEALSWLGESVEEVAEGLRARGIKGRATLANACPLANYLRVWYKNPSIFMEVSVCDDETDYYYVADTPGPCRDFITKFDNHAFPDLIDNG